MMKSEILEVRPYQLMCIICSLGGGHCKVPGDPKVSKIWSILEKSPNIPVMLRCNTISVYRYQNPGTADDTPEGKFFNTFRDLAILQRLGLVPGSMRPAHEFFLRIIENIPSTSGICGFAMDNSETWQGCPLSKSNYYENGIKQGIELLYSGRSDEETQQAKEISSKLIAETPCLKMSPHHLLCFTNFFRHYGTNEWKPVIDNHFEVWERILKEPEVPIELIEGTTMICPACPHYDAENKLCVGKQGISLRNDKKDHNVLQICDLKYGDIVPAKDLLMHVYSKITDTVDACGWHDGVKRSPEWSVCTCSYVKGREKAINELRRL